MSIGPPNAFGDNIDSQTDRAADILCDDFGEILTVKTNPTNVRRIVPIGKEYIASEWIDRYRSRLL